MNAPLYTTEILRLAASLSEPQSLTRVDGSAEQRSLTCGSVVRVDVELDDDGCVMAVSQAIQACAFGQASAALLARGSIGHSRDSMRVALNELQDWLDGVRNDPGEFPGLIALAPARSRKSRHGAILLPFRALLAAMDR
jgi:NifU-like protein involved in Fe-S cluster formation